MPNYENPRAVIDLALREQLTDTTGSPVKPGLLPPATRDEVSVLEERLGIRVPPDLQDLLAFTSGFDFPLVGSVDLLGREMSVQTFFPSIPILGDGFGNFWVVDVAGGNTSGVVMFWCHDPPVVVIQASGLGLFLNSVFDLGRREHNDRLILVRKAHTARIWSEDPYLLSVEQARQSGDVIVASFAKDLPDNAYVADLRTREFGAGFSWGKSDSEPRRAGEHLIFSVEKKRGLLSRLFGRK